MSHDDELWQEYYPNGQPILGVGSTKTSFVENPTKISGSVHVWLWREGKKGRELLFQKRSTKVADFPGLWDISTAGHINLGETFSHAIQREAKEEIGINLDPSQALYILSYPSPNHFTVIHNVFLYPYSGPDDFYFDDQEVEVVKWVPISKVPDFVKSNMVVIRHPHYFDLLLDFLSQIK
jgi:8-oxo-dGTP pyrophosphatase MutT (NUDIX family)